MQDTSTGSMVRVKGLNQESYDEAIPDRKYQGITLTVGEEVSLKGARFVVHSIGTKMVVLRGLPGLCITK